MTTTALTTSTPFDHPTMDPLPSRSRAPEPVKAASRLYAEKLAELAEANAKWTEGDRHYRRAQVRHNDAVRRAEHMGEPRPEALRDTTAGDLAAYEMAVRDALAAELDFADAMREHRDEWLSDIAAGRSETTAHIEELIGLLHGAVADHALLASLEPTVANWRYDLEADATERLAVLNKPGARNRPDFAQCGRERSRAATAISGLRPKTLVGLGGQAFNGGIVS